ncbi:MAG: hypothetical protein V2A70_07430, partial [Candidatus Omnitrophota bacterium]
MLIRSKSAQSMLEYTVMAFIVIMAIVYGAPNLVRAVSARFQGMDDNIQDSFHENIRQAAVQGSYCVCSVDSSDFQNWVPGL